MRSLHQTITRHLLLLFGLFVLGGCTRQKQVYLYELIQTHLADRNNVTRIYIDKYGELYPESIHITFKDFFDPDHKGSTTKYKDSTHGSLRYMFVSDAGRTKSLAESFSISAAGKTNQQIFDEAQAKMLDAYAGTLNQAIAASADKELVIFIHGFNDPNPTGSYQELRNAISAIKPGLPYLEIYWDGLTANNGNPAVERIWGWAQKNSAYVSLTLRSILNKLSTDARIRIVTHSLGASVCTGALWNTTTKWDHSSWDYLTLVGRIATPRQKDIRIGMIAPAIPGTLTFEDFNKRNPDITASDNNISRIIIGHNKNDYALTKTLFAKTQKLAGLFGNTTLGCNYKGTEINDVKYWLENSGGYTHSVVDQLILPVDFSESRAGTLEEHGLHYYIINRHFPEFLNKLFL